MKQQFQAIYERDGEWWIATAIEIPGAFSQGKSLEEARANLLDAVRELTLARRSLMESEIKGKADIVQEMLTLEI